MDARPGRAPARFTHHGRWSHVWLAVLYLCAISLLIVWEYRERLEASSSECTLRDETRSSTYGRWYSSFLEWASPVTTGHVVTVAIPAELEEVQSNVCLGRAYLADVLRAVARENPAVVVIDKFFSPNTCTRSPESTVALLAAVRAVRAPVVVGESTDGVEEPVDGACLVRKPQLDFAAPNVVHGLLRLDSETERLPLQWKVLEAAPEEKEQKPLRHAAEFQPGVAAPTEESTGNAAADSFAAHDAAAQKAAVQEAPPNEATPNEASPQQALPKWRVADSLMLSAARQYDPEFVQHRSVQRLIAHDDHAYSSISMQLPRVTTTELLCAAGDPAVQQRWGLHCTQGALPARLLGKVVVIGAENPSDLRTTLGRHMWGFQLQAMYVESLLSGDYLRTLPLSVDFGLFAFFVFVMEGAPVALVTYRPHWKDKFLLRYAYPHQRYVWVVFWAVVLIAASSVLALALRFLPPLLIYGDILFVAMTRLLHYSAESVEHPLIHAHHHHRKEAHHVREHTATEAPRYETEGHQG